MLSLLIDMKRLEIFLKRPEANLKLVEALLTSAKPSKKNPGSSQPLSNPVKCPEMSRSSSRTSGNAHLKLQCITL